VAVEERRVGTGQSRADQALSVTTDLLAGTVLPVRVTGEVDLATAPRLRAALQAAVGTAYPPMEIAVDLAGVTFIDAVGIGVLIAGRNAARAAGVGFSVRSPQPLVVRVIDVLGLAETLRVVPAPPVLQAGD
jgi:anti-anti-sigma factor